MVAPVLRLRIAELLEERGVTVYRLSKNSGGRLPMRTAYNLVQPGREEVSLAHLAVVCELLEVEPAALFDYRVTGKRRG